MARHRQSTPHRCIFLTLFGYTRLTVMADVTDTSPTDILRSLLVSLQNASAVAAAPAPAYWPASNSSEAVQNYPYYSSQPDIVNLGWLLVWGILVAFNTICTPLLAIAAAHLNSTSTHLTYVHCQDLLEAPFTSHCCALNS